MVGLDPSRDYYAALEISPSCGDDDIKKQYRKLGGHIVVPIQQAALLTAE